MNVFLQSLLDSSQTVWIMVIAMGLLTALSPCPLATNIAAIGYLSKDISSKQVILRNGLLYTLGRTITYTLLAWLLLALLKSGESIFGIQRFLAGGHKWIGAVLILIGLVLLIGDKLHLPSVSMPLKSFGQSGWGALLLGLLFALAFCPTSGILYFGGLIPLANSNATGWLLPILFSVATALPIILLAFVLAFSAQHIGIVYGHLTTIQRWMKYIVGGLFIAIGVYYVVQLFIN